MTKTKFYENVIKHMIKTDVENMKYFFGDRNYEVVIEDNVIDGLNQTMQDFNNFFKDIGLSYEISKNDAIDFVKNSLKPHYSGKNKICIHYEDIYDHLIEKNIFKADEEVSVYRIESKDYKGFYTYFISIGDDKISKYDTSSNTCSPGEDGILALQFMNPEYRDKSTQNIFGYSSKESLFKWITNEDGMINDLAVSDLYISEYKVKEKDLLSTKIQVAFNKDRSRLIKRDHISSVLKGRIEQQEYNKKLSENDDSLEKDEYSTTFLKQDDGDVLILKEKKNSKNKNKLKNQMKLF